MTTKECPHCGGTALGLIRTQFIKYCTDCWTFFPWPLDEDQETLK